MSSTSNMPALAWQDQDGDHFKIYQDPDDGAFAIVQVMDDESKLDKEVYVSRTRAKQLLKWLEDALR